MKKQVSVWLYIIVMILVTTACDPGRVYDQTYAVDGQAWNRDSVFHYELLIEDSLSINDFYITIRNNTEYPYSNLYLFITTRFPNGHATKDTIECILADKNGKWLGTGSGRIRDNRIMLQQALRFPLKGIYHFYIEQGMRDEQLPGIEDIGLRIERSKPRT